MENNDIHTSEYAQTVLKPKALKYLPQNLNDTNAQKAILKMVEQVLPADSVSYLEKTSDEILAKQNRAELSVGQAIAQCAYQTDSILKSRPVSHAKLAARSEEVLLQVWIAVDYYAYILKPEYSANLRLLQNQISTLLLEEKKQSKSGPNAAAAGNRSNATAADIPKTVPIEKPVKPDNTVTRKQDGKNKKTDPGKTKVDKTMRRRRPILALAVVLIAILAAGFLFSKTRRTEVSIRKIGTVTLESEALILEAEEHFDGLSENQQEKISNRDLLFAARAEYDSLVAEDAIGKIGKVTLESADAITGAEEIYAALSRDAKNLVDNYKTLTAARKEYDRLDAAVTKASTAIDAIGNVTLRSGDKIKEARDAYDALAKDDLQKYLSDKEPVLKNAEKEYRQLYSQDLYDTGVAHHQNGEYEAAIKAFDTIIADYSDTKVLGSAKQARADSQIALAEAAYKKSDHYTAMKTLDAVEETYRSSETYEALKEKVVTAVTRARPRSGAVVDGKIDWGYCYFNITAGSEDVCFKFENTADPSKYKMVFVRAGEKKKVNVEDGIYSIKWAIGKYWFGKDHLFGDDTQFRSRGTTVFTTTREGSWIHFWSHRLDLSDPSAQFNIITAQEF